MARHLRVDGARRRRLLLAQIDPPAVSELPDPTNAMGLAPKFKAYLLAEFPQCCTPPGPDDQPASAVVVDVMVTLHAHSVRPGDESPALWLAQTLWFAISDFQLISLCFDVSATTPAAKSIEWSTRPAPEVVVTSEDVLAALAENDLPDFPSLIASRSARTTLCRWLVQRMAERLTGAQTMLVLDDGVPTVYRCGSSEARPDLARATHGEADIACVFAANVLRDQFGAASVDVNTCDTDLVLISCLNAFEGLRVRLIHFDAATKRPVLMWVDCWKLAHAGPAKYGLTLMEWGALLASRGTDYVHGGVIRGVGDWETYMRGCSEALRDVKRTRGGRPIVTDDVVEAGALHTVFVAASERMKRAKVKYERDDGTMARLAWNCLYFRHCPSRGCEGLDCMQFGWGMDGGRVAVQNRPPGTFGLLVTRS